MENYGDLAEGSPTEERVVGITREGIEEGARENQTEGLPMKVELCEVKTKAEQRR